MKRTDLAKIAEKHGIKRGKRPTEAQRAALRADIEKSLTRDEDLARAPRVFTASGAGSPMTLTDATDALLEEVEAIGGQDDA